MVQRYLLPMLQFIHKTEVDGMAWQDCFQRWPSSDGMHLVGRNNPYGTKEQARDASGQAK